MNKSNISYIKEFFNATKENEFIVLKEFDFKSSSPYKLELCVRELCHEEKKLLLEVGREAFEGLQIERFLNFLKRNEYAGNVTEIKICKNDCIAIEFNSITLTDKEIRENRSNFISALDMLCANIRIYNYDSNEIVEFYKYKNYLILRTIDTNELTPKNLKIYERDVAWAGRKARDEFEERQLYEFESAVDKNIDNDNIVSVTISNYCIEVELKRARIRAKQA